MILLMYISIDLGGTNTRIASSSDLKSIECVTKFPTNKDLDVELSLISNGLATVTNSKITKISHVKAISLGIPGVIDFKNGSFHKVPHYAQLNDKPYNFLMPASFKATKMLAANDAALAGYAEAIHGAGAKFASVAYLTLSTGVGGTLIKDKDIAGVFSSFEPGHIIIAEDGRYNSHCKQKGCLESYVSGTAFEEIYGISPEKCNDLKIWGKYAKHLASGIVNLATLWSPEVVVLGGKLATKFELFYKPLMDELAKQSFVKLPAIRQSKYADDSGLLGGFLLIDTFRRKSLV